MGKAKQNENIRDNYNIYEGFLKCNKNLLSPNILINKDRDKDINHVGSLKRRVPMHIDTLEDCCLEVVVNEINTRRFNFLIDHEISQPLHAVRFDSDGQTHKNNLPNIPLEEQQVTTPHFHKYRSDGFLIAYKTEKLIKNETNLSLSCMFPIFCEEFNIGYPSKESINIDISMDGEINFGEDEYDPHQNINFEL